MSNKKFNRRRGDSDDSAMTTDDENAVRPGMDAEDFDGMVETEDEEIS